MDSIDTVRVGRITGPHGVGGEVKVHPFGAEEFFAAVEGSVFKKFVIDGVPYEIESARRHGEVMLIKLKGVGTRDEAFELRGKDVSVATGELPPPGESEYYWFDLEGMDVRTEDQTELGRIFNIFTTASNDVFEVRGPFGEIMIPAIEGVLLGVDAETRTVTVRLPEGLLPEKPA